MSKVDYQVVTFPDLSALIVGKTYTVWQKGAVLRSLEVSLISPVTQRIDLHFGENNNPIPTEHGRSYADDDTADLYDDGVFFSLPAAAPAGSSLVFTVYQ